MAETIIRSRTVKECLEYIKTLDPDTAITEWFIRTLCKDNKIQYFASGKKLLINLDNLISYINYNAWGCANVQ